ncbi:MAG: rhodanese-like domain-containing protein [Rhodospirillales bacterium]|nr:rhodanese-like domain-containing protein [Rhodospirillales bacterium]
MARRWFLLLATSVSAALAPPAAAATALVDVAWLAERTCSDGLLVLDVRRSRADHETGHVPCATFTNFYEDGWRETQAGVPMRLPEPVRTAELLGRLGVSPDDHVIIVAPGSGRYDAAEAAAIFVSLRSVGHAAVSILDGGLAAWTARWDNDVDTGYQPPVAGSYTPRRAPPILADRAAVGAAITSGHPLVDLRTSDQYLGLNRNETVLRHGTLPGARNVPLAWFLVDDTLVFHPPATVRAALDHAGVPADADPVVFCNAGLESSLGWFVLHELLGRTGTRLYDGSLAEWSRVPELPMQVIVGPPG